MSSCSGGDGGGSASPLVHNQPHTGRTTHTGGRGVAIDRRRPCDIDGQDGNSSHRFSHHPGPPTRAPQAGESAAGGRPPQLRPAAPLPGMPVAHCCESAISQQVDGPRWFQFLLGVAAVAAAIAVPPCGWCSADRSRRPHGVFRQDDVSYGAGVSQGDDLSARGVGHCVLCPTFVSWLVRVRFPPLRGVLPHARRSNGRPTRSRANSPRRWRMVASFVYWPS